MHLEPVTEICTPRAEQNKNTTHCLRLASKFMRCNHLLIYSSKKISFKSTKRPFEWTNWNSSQNTLWGRKSGGVKKTSQERLRIAQKREKRRICPTIGCKSFLFFTILEESVTPTVESVLTISPNSWIRPCIDKYKNPLILRCHMRIEGFGHT